MRRLQQHFLALFFVCLYVLSTSIAHASQDIHQIYVVTHQDFWIEQDIIRRDFDVRPTIKQTINQVVKVLERELSGAQAHKFDFVPRAGSQWHQLLPELRKRVKDPNNNYNNILTIVLVDVDEADNIDLKLHMIVPNVLQDAIDQGIDPLDIFQERLRTGAFATGRADINPRSLQPSTASGNSSLISVYANKIVAELLWRNILLKKYLRVGVECVETSPVHEQFSEKYRHGLWNGIYSGVASGINTTLNGRVSGFMHAPSPQFLEVANSKFEVRPVPCAARSLADLAERQLLDLALKSTPKDPPATKKNLPNMWIDIGQWCRSIGERPWIGPWNVIGIEIDDVTMEELNLSFERKWQTQVNKFEVIPGNVADNLKRCVSTICARMKNDTLCSNR